MKKTTAVLLGAAAFAIGGTAPAMATPAEPGTPGEANCVGQSMAYLTQYVADDHIHHGLGNFVHHLFPVGALQGLVREYCSR